ncbi:hypothetical protein TraAM80_01690 [Trypanosoma rangeli]|uniref:Uncharacterized protein n=1 Tax=Trypanosoma rangeli TaxID=5698 RepID=A0A422NY26_TRYRA|nr:uncharacterized protein TraAM80_01690 [Trypanosoma rangeli]RNF10331.1 hypothetical protein TraAM80_01690 [Trypanosoma rangeli]|eukprot:RNF10331.1 hypothetical protein TraAM80_01690 [Trypanosoma rangeli]
MASYYARLDNFFAFYAPEKRPLVAALLEKYSGREEVMMQSLVKKFGPEPTGPASNFQEKDHNYRERLVNFYTKYAPKELAKVDAMLARFAGREDELFSALVQKYGPEPSMFCSRGDLKSVQYMSDTQCEQNSIASSVAVSGYNVHDTRWRLARIFMEHAPERLAIVDQMMEKYAGHEEEMLVRCVERYGPEPPPPDTQSPRSRLSRFIGYYMPHKVSSVESMLKKYDGRIEALFAALVYKLGPEPPSTPCTTSAVVVPVGNEAAGPSRGVTAITGGFRDDDEKGSHEVYQDVEEPGEWLKHLSLPLSAYRRYAVNRLGEDHLSVLENRFGVPRLLDNRNNADDSAVKRWVIAKNVVTGTGNVNAVKETEEFEEPMVAECISANFACFVLVLETVEFPLPEDYMEESIFACYPFCTLLGDRDRFALQTCVRLMDLKTGFEADTVSLLREEENCRERVLQQVGSWKRQHCVQLEDRKSYMQRLLQRALELLPEFEEKERQEVITVEQIERKGKALWFHEGLQMITSANRDLLTPHSRQKWEHEKNVAGRSRYADLSSPFAPFSCGFRHLISPHPLLRQKGDDCILLSSQSSTSSVEESMSVPLGGRKETRDMATVTTPAMYARKPSLQRATNADSVFGLLEVSPQPKKPSEVVDPIQRVLRFNEPLTGSRRTMHTENRLGITGRDKWGPAREGRLSEVAPPPCQDAREAILLSETPESFVDHVSTDQSDRASSPAYRYVPFFFEKEDIFRSGP